MIKNRIQLAKHFNELGYKVGAEVGVFDGHYSVVLCREIPGVKLYAIDPWTVYEGYRTRKFEPNMAAAKKLAYESLEPYNCHIIEDFSVEAAKTFADESLDFVYIDGNHEYSHVKADIEAWTPKVRQGGILAGHDYYVTRAGNTGVVDAVDEFTKKHNYTLNVIPKDPFIQKQDDQQPNWWFVK